MNAAQRRIARRARPAPDTCGLQGHSGTTTYPDLMCVDGRMTDMDDDGYDPSTWRAPCKNCLPEEWEEWQRELLEESLPHGFFLRGKEIWYECRGCGNDRKWQGDSPPNEDDYRACGGSPTCIP